MTTQRHKLRAVVLAALMVFSVIAMGTAFVGTAAADYSVNSFSPTTVDTVETTHNFNFNVSATDNNSAASQTLTFIQDFNF